MDSIETDLRSYYETEANLGLRKALRGRRIEFRDWFIALLAAEQRRSVVDFGAGPGHDGVGFCDAGHFYVGLDLAQGNGVLAADCGVDVVQGSIKMPPFPIHSFDAGWSMSTIMHLPDSDMPQALSSMAQTLKPGAPFGIGLWGASPSREPADEISAGQIKGEQRLFSLRAHARNRELFGAAATIEHESVWQTGEEGWEYHVFVLRV